MRLEMHRIYGVMEVAADSADIWLHLTHKPFPLGTCRMEAVVNSGFENGLTGWSADQSFRAMASSISHSGSGLVVTTPPTSMAYLQQSLTTISGRPTQLSFWLRRMSWDVGEANKFAVELDPPPAELMVLPLIDGDPNAPQLNPATLRLDTAAMFEWAHYRIQFKPFADSTAVKFGVQSDAAASAEWYLDDISVQYGACSSDDACSGKPAQYCKADGTCAACSTLKEHW